MKVWLVGENNPYSRDPRYDLYFDPPESAGGRLCRLILGMRERDYLRSFERRNLLAAPRWSIPAARFAAAELAKQVADADRVVLLGRKVFDAWPPTHRGATAYWTPFEVRNGGSVLLLPHPSGLSRAWNEPGAFARARECVAQVAPHLRPLLGVTKEAA